MSGRACPRASCANTMQSPGLIVCSGDFAALAGMCRGKKRLGEPLAAQIEGSGGGRAYECPLCRMWHNGSAPRNRMDLKVVARATVAALSADPRVGWRGLLALADTWAPPATRRAEWHVNLDQADAYQ